MNPRRTKKDGRRWGSDGRGAVAGLLLAALLAAAAAADQPGAPIEVAPGITKATGLSRLSNQLDVHAGEVMVFGDMPNDIPMLHWAGWGVAMGNAHDAATEVADEITATNADDGVAVILEALLTG